MIFSGQSLPFQVFTDARILTIISKTRFTGRLIRPATFDRRHVFCRYYSMRRAGSGQRAFGVPVGRFEISGIRVTNRPVFYDTGNSTPAERPRGYCSGCRLYLKDDRQGSIRRFRRCTGTRRASGVVLLMDRACGVRFLAAHSGSGQRNMDLRLRPIVQRLNRANFSNIVLRERSGFRVVNGVRAGTQHSVGNQVRVLTGFKQDGQDRQDKKKGGRSTGQRDDAGFQAVSLYRGDLLFSAPVVCGCLGAGCQGKWAGFDPRVKGGSAGFYGAEIAAISITKTFQPPPDRVFGGLTVGEFSWGSFARALAAQADIGGNRTIAGKDTARAVAEMGLIEGRQGGKAFAQLYSTLALRHYGTDLSKNAVWQSLNEEERNVWYSLLDPARFYDAKKRAVINLPENYLGVAVRVAAVSYELGVLKDRALLDSLVERARAIYERSDLLDDSPPTGRYDAFERYAGMAGGRRDCGAAISGQAARSLSSDEIVVDLV